MKRAFAPAAAWLLGICFGLGIGYQFGKHGADRWYATRQTLNFNGTDCWITYVDAQGGESIPEPCAQTGWKIYVKRLDTP